MLTQTEKSIINALSFFDIFNFPLTKEELWQNLWTTDSPVKADQVELFKDFNRSLERLTPKYVAAIGGFYSIDKTGIADKIVKRKQNYLTSIAKTKIALRNARLLCRLPHVRAIFLCNTLAYGNANPNSDIDFFMITRENRIFTARFFANALLKILRRRPTKQNAKNKICLSFLVDSNHLRLGDLLYQDDVYFHYWFKQLVPIFDPENFGATIWSNNSWMQIKLPNATRYVSSSRQSIARKTGIFKKIAEFFCGQTLELFLRRLQLGILPETIRKKIREQTSDVVIGNDIIKLHTNDRRLSFKKQWREKIKKIYEQS